MEEPRDPGQRVARRRSAGFPDGFVYALAADAEYAPAAGIVLLQRDFDGQILLTEEQIRLFGGRITLEFLRLPYEGAYNGDTPHYGLLLFDGAFRILIPGDCEIVSPSLARYLEGSAIDLAILNFPRHILRRVRWYLKEVLRPPHVLLGHFPPPEDNANSYLEAADLADVWLLTRPLQREAT